jgi:hypothetical protein
MTQKALLQSAGDGSAIPAGCVGERLDGTWLNPSNAVGIKNAFSINLTSGTWMIYGKVYMQSAGATGYIEIFCSISTVSNTSDNSSSLNNVNSTVSRDVICSSLPRCLTVSGPTPVYFVVSNSLGGGSFSAGWQQAASSFYAIRIA